MDALNKLIKMFKALVKDPLSPNSQLLYHNLYKRCEQGHLFILAERIKSYYSIAKISNLSRGKDEVNYRCNRVKNCFSILKNAYYFFKNRD